jgi:phosphatidylglycerol lysyltransferase
MTDTERARQLILKHGWNSTAYQILNPGIEYWFHPSIPAVVGLVRESWRWIAAGAPVCSKTDLRTVTIDFENAAQRDGCRVCYVCAAERLRNLYRDSPDHSMITIGAQPVWDPRDWPAIASEFASVRVQLNRARNKSVKIVQWPAERGRTDADLRTCLEDWLSRRYLPPLHFMTEPDTLDGVLHDRLLWVAMRAEQPVGFLLASPVPQRNGYLLEQIVRSRHAPNGTAELLIDAAMRSLAEKECSYATLGLVALAQHAGDTITENPFWLRAVLGWARAHGCRFYNFRGLESFRTKLHPKIWEPIYAIANEPQFSPYTLHAIAAAFCKSSPAVALVRAVGRAIYQEARWLAQRVRA